MSTETIGERPKPRAKPDTCRNCGEEIAVFGPRAGWAQCLTCGEHQPLSATKENQ